MPVKVVPLTVTIPLDITREPLPVLFLNAPPATVKSLSEEITDRSELLLLNMVSVTLMTPEFSITAAEPATLSSNVAFVIVSSAALRTAPLRVFFTVTPLSSFFPVPVKLNAEAIPFPSTTILESRSAALPVNLNISVVPAAFMETLSERALSKSPLMVTVPLVQSITFSKINSAAMPLSISFCNASISN